MLNLSILGKFLAPFRIKVWRPYLSFSNNILVVGFILYRCNCGNSNVALLENPKECCCCKELSKCSDILSDNEVIKAVGQQPSCITNILGLVLFASTDGV